MLRSLVIIGSGPAGLTAAIYAGRAGLSPLVISGTYMGGLPTLTDLIENYPGFPDGINGMEFTERVRRQAERFGAEFVQDEVTGVDLSAHPFTVETGYGQYRAKALIVATGTYPRKLGVPGEGEYTGKGVSYCAVCDGFFFRGKEVAVVGGGDVAAQEAIYLSKLASKVYMIHRRDRLRATRVLQDLIERNDRIDVRWNSVVDEIIGEPDSGVRGLKLRDVRSGEISELRIDGVFISVGYIPNAEIFRGQLELDSEGYISVDSRQRTSVEGVFAAGDVQDPYYRQIVIASAAGAKAAIEAERFISELEGRAYK